MSGPIVKPRMAVALSYAHFLGRGPGIKPTTNKSPSSRLVIAKAPEKRSKIKKKVQPAKARNSTPSFAHLVPAAQNYRSGGDRAESVATAKAIVRSAAIARGEIILKPNAPPQGSLAAKILAAGEKRRRL